MSGKLLIVFVAAAAILLGAEALAPLSLGLGDPAFMIPDRQIKCAFFVSI